MKLEDLRAYLSREENVPRDTDDSNANVSASANDGRDGWADPQPGDVFREAGGVHVLRVLGRNGSDVLVAREKNIGKGKGISSWGSLSAWTAELKLKTYDWVESARGKR